MTTSLTKEQKRVLILSSLGGVLEYYDFIIYIFLAPIIEKVFFADSSTYVATLKTLAIFAVGYLVRPLGGIIFSHFGDRYGRKVVFLLTVLFMALPSFAIGLLPTPAQIGMISPLLLLVFRMMQGVALGGEIPAAITFVSEHVSTQRRGFALSTLFWGINFGLMLGSLITTLFTRFMSADALLAYGWRIPFLIGGVFGIASLWLRRYLKETAAFKALHTQDLEPIPLVALLKHSSKNVFRGVLLVSLGAVTVFFYLYWPQYLHQYMNYDFSALMHLNSLCTLVLSFMILVGGLLVDKLGAPKVYLIVSTLLMVFAYPLFLLFNLNSMTWVAVSYLLFSLLFALIPASYTSILSQLFPTPVRYSGIAVSYNLAYALFGGLSPVVCTIAIHSFGTVMAPAFYVMFVAFLSLLAVLSLPTETDQSLENESPVLV